MMPHFFKVPVFYRYTSAFRHFRSDSSMPKIISANLNGIRSAASKGFFNWMAKQDADFVCVQELKAQAPDMTPEFLNPGGYHGHFHYAEKKAIPAPACTARSNRTAW
jgi:exodeoxyribonuclease-3